ncbi:hypothetical protein D9M69_333480 [compost metagenome]
MDRLRRTDGDDQPLPSQLVRQVLEALPFLAQAVAGRHTHLVEEQLCGVLALEADLLQQTPLGETLSLLFDADQRQLLGRWIELGGGHHQPGVAAIGDEGLLPGNDVIFAIAARQGAHRAQVAADARLAHGDHADQLAADHARQPLLLLLLGAIGDNVGRNDLRVGGETHGGGIGPRQFLDHHCGVAEIATGTAIFLRHCGAQQAKLAGLQPDVLGHDAVLFPFMQVGHDLTVDETSCQLAEHIVVFTENATHCTYSNSVGFSTIQITRLALVHEGSDRLLVIFRVMGQGLVGGRQLQQRIEAHVLAFTQQAFAQA